MLRDIFMRLAVALVFQPKWTDRIHTEWIENVLKNRPDLERESLIPSLSLPDDNDRHVLAAAVAAQAAVIVTLNLSDFPESQLAPYGIRALHPDALLSELAYDVPDAFVAAIRHHRYALRNPVRTPDQYIASFVDNGLTQIAGWLDQFKDRI